MNCWELMKCARERGGAKAKDFGACPAYPNYGKCCAQIAGTLCGGNVTGSFAVRLGNCKKCRFYRSTHYRHSNETHTIRIGATNQANRHSPSHIMQGRDLPLLWSSLLCKSPFRFLPDPQN
jgi:hypothetical protein